MRGATWSLRTYRGSLRTGEGDILVQGGPDVAGDDRAATGLKVDRHGRLFVSGADSKHIRVYDARTGAQLRDYFAGDDAGFINDVIVTKRGAYFTDSNNAWLYFIPFGDEGELGELRRIPLGGDYVIDAGFNANGIVAARGGKSLIVVKSNTGELFEVDAATGIADRSSSPAATESWSTRSTATCSRSRPPSRAPAAATTWSMRSSACPTPAARSRS